jgi:hypothetical protein
MTQTINNFPHPIREIENIWIPLADGIRLAARIWLPQDAEDNPVPALLEYLPYRKNDGTAVRDAVRHPYLAGHGYALVRVDLRGSGDSDGVLLDEYLKQEQDDALEVLAWIADQPWCDGNIGMFGISWGGFNSLQVAARRPPQLKAILVIGFTDDRYNDDVHYMGGCVLASQMLSWASVMFAYNACPPDPRWVGEKWREMWLERMEGSPRFVEAWLSHQRRDAYWKHGSVGEDYSAINIPVYAVGGWADAYNNSIPRLLAGLNVPRKGLVGPWCHSFPETGYPGPAIGFLQEALRWWDYWLKGKETGVMDGPMLRCWINEWEPPKRYYPTRNGRWVADPSWPSPNVHSQTWYLNGDRTMQQQATDEHALTIKGLQTHGLDCGEWGMYGTPGEYAGDQRSADGEALTFTSPPATEAVDMLGNPIVELSLAVDRPNALVAARLCDVAPDGSSMLVSWGLLNLTHRESHEFPTPLEPGRPYTVRVQLNFQGYRLPAGHCWRIALSPTYWRQAWPSPEPVTLTLFAGEACRLLLPIRTPSPADEQLPPFAEPELSPPLPVEIVRPESSRRLIEHDLSTAVSRYRIEHDDGRIRYPHGLEVADQGYELFRIEEGKPLSAAVNLHRRIEFKRDDWHIIVQTFSEMTADATHFHISNLLQTFENGSQAFANHWTFLMARDMV